MELLELMLKRRSIRRYEDRRIEEEDLSKIIHAGLSAPSSRNFHSAKMMVIEDRHLIAQLAKAKSTGAAFLSKAPCAIVVYGDEDKCDVWIEDCAIMMTQMMLMATELNIGNCWIQMRLRDNAQTSANETIKALLQLKSNEQVLSVLALGYPDQTLAAHKVDELDMSRVSMIK